MDQTQILTDINKELQKNYDPKYAESVKRFYKKGEFTGSSGVKTPIVRKISTKYFRLVKNKSKEEIFELCEKLLYTKTSSTIAFDWAFRIRDRFEKKDFKTFELWLEKYVNSWSKCDSLCCGALGYLVFEFPIPLNKLISWSRSKNRWFRRASAVSLIYSIRRKKRLRDVFEISDRLLLDNDDLVQKGYGWLLKEAGNNYQKEVFNFVMKRKNKMPRTALRYAIEKMPEKMRKKAMAK